MPSGKRLSAQKDSRWSGDVHPEVAEVAGALTPVPGGVGPLTIAMLMYNTVKAAKMRRGQWSVASGQWPVDPHSVLAGR